MSSGGESATLIEGRPVKFSNLTFPLAVLFMIFFHFGGSYDVAPYIEEQEIKDYRSILSSLSAASVLVPVRENAAGLQSARVVSSSEHSAY
jgi:hypothetical protein